jgi:transposase
MAPHGKAADRLLAEFARGRLRKLPALRETFTGRFRSEHHGLLVSQILAHIDYLDATIASMHRLDSRA